MKVSMLMIIGYLNCCNSDTFLASGQSFQNLDFESANVPDLLPGEFGGWVSITDALPGWNAYLGSETQTAVLHNYLSLGSTLISLIGPAFTSLEGEYCLDLYAGVDINDASTPLSASISQTGVVPGDARSLMFKTQGIATMDGPLRLVVSLGDELISMVPISSTSPHYTLYGGDISTFAGRQLELKVTALPFTAHLVDSIEFSSVPIPEPTTWVLLGLGGLMAAWFGRRAHGKRVGRHNNKGWQEDLTARK